MEQVTIYHNPNCGTSRNALAIIRAVGIEPTIIEYLKTPPTEQKLRQLLLQMNMSARELLRTNVPEFEEYDLQKDKTEQDIINAMMVEPILINRPIVVTDKGTLLCRPSEKVLNILPKSLDKDFIKEDGEIISSSSR
ncbi:arsenate reductase (glutaredoxin) [Streptococcus parasanguinis]|uniref:arsenate reductase (glutathione/glutaredoxin) n=1 Tax=Streptococcus parasanguinis (strain ATCC 15912 / DSM 6778 / CIP 104372 / LMG 14537) TaxID=760570 RepID=F8DHS8_STREP|nr:MULTISPECIES: arsenate reductase (glutaredoxin) [Streptococcus]HEM3617212.1 arsenate reductase (glutaredoxin) [Streptococcus suis]AEH56849.1 arsenate reductase [Streptococcus parasanguinis ATCC 15912]SUN83830.1 arsenate reductase [Streptococcus parasanguinis]HEM3651266.1 arsenate reductase (glutaredoxin) [Streptococcus suis]HEM3659675.1 arsenate reductase (glutaredoxin) [Streptococcus suis]